jgi:Na+/proline symporter
MRWIVGALYSGYVVANVLKWHWWRFNGSGYFWGMVSGMVAAMALPKIAADWQPLADWIAANFGVINDLYFIPPILAVSTLGSVIVTFLAPPVD